MRRRSRHASLTPAIKDLQNERLNTARIRHAWCACKALVASQRIQSTQLAPVEDEDAFPPSDELQDLTTMWFKRSSATTSSLILLACPVIALHWSGRGRLRLLRKPASWLVAVCERSESRGCGGVVVAERERNLAVPLC